LNTRAAERREREGEGLDNLASHCLLAVKGKAYHLTLWIIEKMALFERKFKALQNLLQPLEPKAMLLVWGVLCGTRLQLGLTSANPFAS